MLVEASIKPPQGGVNRDNEDKAVVIEGNLRKELVSSLLNTSGHFSQELTMFDQVISTPNCAAVCELGG